MNTDENSMSEGLARFDIVFYVRMSDGFSQLPEHGEEYELHRLLGTLLSEELTVKERLDIIENEYDIPIEENIRMWKLLLKVKSQYWYN